MTGLKIARGSDVYLLLAWTRDGAALDLTGATLSAWLKHSPDDAPVIADTSGSAMTLVAFDALTGLAILRLKPAATSGLSRDVYYYAQAQAVLASGETVICEAHQFLLALSPVPSSLNPLPGGFDMLPVTGVSPWLEPGGTANPLLPAMSNFLILRPDIVGLGVTYPGATKLSGLAAAVLAVLQDGAVVRLTLAGEITADYRLVTGTIGTEGQWQVACDNAPTRYWQLCNTPSKQGAPSVWVSSLTKFKQVLEAAGALALADDADAFVIPD